MRRWLTAAVLVATLTVAAPRPASAHALQTGVEAVLGSSPTPSPGVTVRVVPGIVDLLTVTDRAPVPLVVEGASGRPFLRISAAGVDADVGTPDWTASEGVAVPGLRPLALPSATSTSSVAARPARTAPQWTHVTDDSTWSWADPRLRPSRASGGWRVPITIGTRLLVISGRIHQYAITGEWDSAIDPASLTALPGLAVATVDARAPSLVASFTGTHTVVLIGPGGEPEARFGTDGIDVNAASPAWLLTATLAGRAPQPPVGTHVAPRWLRVATPLQWLEPRMGYPARAPSTHSTAPVVVAHWSVPFRVDGADVALRGTTAWQWYGYTSGGGWLSSGPHRGVVFGGVLVLVGAAYAVFRRRGAGSAK